jgi:sensor domain CHASE-containing protein
MNIRPKVVAWVALSFAILISVEILIQERVFMPSFAALERSEAQTAMLRIRMALDRTLDGLQSNNQAWSNWRELYDFMQGSNAGFLATYTTPVATAALKIDLLAIVDPEGRYVFSEARDFATGQAFDIDLAARDSLPEDFPWRQNLSAGKPARGLILTNRGILMLSAAPIFDGSGSGRPLGMTLMGRLLTRAQLEMIATESLAHVTLIDQPPLAERERIVTGQSLTQVYRSFDDIYGRPRMTLRVDLPRSITARGDRAVWYSVWCLLGAAVLVLILVLVILNRVVLAPIARLTRHALAVGGGDDLSARLNSTSRDEIGHLARAFDHMVDRLAASRREFMERSYQAGVAERAKSVLHDVGNAMTPIEVRLSLLAARLRSAPLDDVRQAAEELAVKPMDVARRDDLQSLIQLGCREVAVALQGAAGDIAVMQSQAQSVRSALALSLLGQTGSSSDVASDVNGSGPDGVICQQSSKRTPNSPGI